MCRQDGYNLAAVSPIPQYQHPLQKIKTNGHLINECIVKKYGIHIMCSKLNGQIYLTVFLLQISDLLKKINNSLKT